MDTTVRHDDIYVARGDHLFEEKWLFTSPCMIAWFIFSFSAVKITRIHTCFSLLLTKSINFTSLTVTGYFSAPAQGWLTRRTNCSLVSINAIRVLGPIEQEQLKKVPKKKKKKTLPTSHLDFDPFVAKGSKRHIKKPLFFLHSVYAL